MHAVERLCFVHKIKAQRNPGPTHRVRTTPRRLTASRRTPVPPQIASLSALASLLSASHPNPSGGVGGACTAVNLQRCTGAPLHLHGYISPHCTDATEERTKCDALTQAAATPIAGAEGDETESIESATTVSKDVGSAMLDLCKVWVPECIF